METLLPLHIGAAFLLLLFQTYLIFYITTLFLRRLKLLKRPYNGMDYPEALVAAVVIAGILFISSADVSGLFQAAQSYTSYAPSTGKPLLLFFARSFMIVLFFGLLYIFLSFVNLRLLFYKQNAAPGLVTAILAGILALGIALIFWFACREIIDGMTPKLFNFQSLP